VRLGIKVLLTLILTLFLASNSLLMCFPKLEMTYPEAYSTLLKVVEITSYLALLLSIITCIYVIKNYKFKHSKTKKIKYLPLGKYIT
jgi:positive regulator of sigma E activity